MVPAPVAPELLGSPLDLWKLMALPQDALVVWLLVLVRLTSLIVTAPIFSAVQIPVRFRLGLGLCASVILLPLELGGPHRVAINGMGSLLVAVAGECVVGLILGFIAMFVFHGIQFAGYMIGLQMGFGMDQIFDPTSGQSLTSLSMFLTIVGTLAYMMLDAHHWLLLALDHSFQVVPLGTFRFTAHTMSGILAASSGLFTIVFALLLPFLGILLLAEVALAIMNRVMPQLNVFVAGFPVKIGLGFASIIIGLPLMVAFFDDMFARWTHQLLTFLG